MPIIQSLSKPPRANRVLLRLAFLVFSSCLLPSARSGAQDVIQASPQEKHLHAVECKIAAEMLEHGIPRVKQTWARSVIMDCPTEAAATYSQMLRRSSPSRDTSELAFLVRAALFTRDTGFFNAALHVASQVSASPEARAAGFLIAAMEARDNVIFDLGEILASPAPMPGCVGGTFDHLMRSKTAGPLPSDVGSRLRSAIGAAESAPTTPVQVKTAVMCIGSSARALP